MFTYYYVILRKYRACILIEIVPKYESKILRYLPLTLICMTWDMCSNSELGITSNKTQLPINWAPCEHWLICSHARTFELQRCLRFIFLFIYLFFYLFFFFCCKSQGHGAFYSLSKTLAFYVNCDMFYLSTSCIMKPITDRNFKQQVIPVKGLVPNQHKPSWHNWKFSTGKCITCKIIPANRLFSYVLGNSYIM